ncbi:alpha/beta hydrolase [Myxococcota bacterium]|nr:alpha/beta hydrolase [Myxococcota bacterium]
MAARKRMPGAPEPMRYWEGHSGIRIAGDHWGQENGPLVVLLHGGGQTRHAWKGAGEALGEAGYQAIALDARGHGDSGWAPNGDYGQDAQVADLVNVVAQLGNKRPVLVGASMGGGTSLGAIGEDHIDATALILVDVAPQIEKDGARRIMEFMRQKPEGFDTLEEVAEAISNYQPHRERPRKLDGLAKNLRLGDNNKFHWHWDPEFMSRPRDMEKRSERLAACAKKLTLPTLLVRGGLSDVLSEEGARKFLDLCPHAIYVNVTDAAHMVAGDRNDIFSKSVIDFLGQNVPVQGEPVQRPHVTHPHHEGPPGDVEDIP